MFFDGINRGHHFFLHLRNQRVEADSSLLHKIIDIKSVEKEMVVTKKSKLAILEVIPLNLAIKTEEEQESVLMGFEKFLNSLDYPIQIHISSHSISLDSHFSYLEKKTSDFPDLFSSYKEFVTKTVSGLKNRKFYIVITEKDNLQIQTRVCEEKLRSLGLRVNRVTGESLVSLFHNYIGQGAQKELAEDQVIEEYAHFLLSPQKITFHHDAFEVGDQFCTLLNVKGYPHSVERGFLDKIISSGDTYDISIHIEPFPLEETMIHLNRELQKQQADLYADTKKGIYNPSLEIKFEATKRVLEDLQKGSQKLFNVSLYILCKGKKREDAVFLAKKVKADLEGLMIQSGIPQFQMQAGYESMLPLGKDRLRLTQNIHTKGLSAFFPFSSPFLDVENDGVLLGLNKNKIPYIKNVFNLTNANGIILATSGAGKSYFTKLLISRLFMNGADIIIIDPQGEYGALTQHYHGETITISKNSSTIINPLDLMGHEYLEKRLSLMDLFQIMLGDITEVQKAILDKAVDITYGRRGINRDSWDSKPPILQELYQTLVNLNREAHSQEKKTYMALLNRLGMYAENGVFSFLNRHTNINFSNRFVCFNIGSMPKQVKPVVMYLVLDYVYQRMKGSLKRKILVIDEAWAMLQTAEESSYVFEIVKTCRKFNLGLLMITQDVADLVGSKAGHAVLANTSYTFLLRQKPAVIHDVARTFHLSGAEKEYLISAQKGQGVLILENEHQEIEVIASAKEHELITTNPDEIQGAVREDVRVDRVIGLDIEQDVYTTSGLSVEEQNFLANNGYVLGSFHGLRKGRQQQYFVKVRKPESAMHTYYVDLIYREVLKRTSSVEKYRTQRPDIVFVNSRNEEIVIEVETGIGVKQKKKEHDEKFGALRKKYGGRCFIFLVNFDLQNSYKRHGLPLLLRLDIEKFIESQFV
ncbi:DUF87 domain-containing protein [Candidatus Woesearchaeota archaeon]|nr:DUF87 domain-containing protein [Candidatus Woesearchaeota archaeon]